MGEEFDLENLFSYHSPKGTQQERYATIRDAGKAFAQVIVNNCPSSADKSVAIRKVREAVMNANVSIAVNENDA